MPSHGPREPRPTKARRAALASAKLVFPRGVATVALRGGARGLYEVRAEEGSAPVVEELDGTVVVRPAHRWFRRNRPLEVRLSEALPWEIEIRGGAAELRADLGDVTLRSIEIGGGVSEATLVLGRPQGACALRIGGGVSALAVRRPHGVGLRLLLAGGASELVLDHFRFAAVGGVVRWESVEYRGSTDRYELEIGGGAHALSVAIGGSEDSHQ